MATVELWIQLENKPWDACPGGVDRMTGETMQARTGRAPQSVTLTSPGTGVTSVRTMHAPLRAADGSLLDALLYRRYKAPRRPDQMDAWTEPDDRKVNPWDLNEPDPTDSGTQGTIPGATLECSVGDDLVVHFRNLDRRPLAIEHRVHSMHPHGVVFQRHADGAYPLSPPDPTQPIPPSEQAAWALVPGFRGRFKQGDRVPPGGTFTYRWSTHRWPSTAGVWLYHDHSICDMDNVDRGAVGAIVIHNPADADNEVDLRVPGEPDRFDPSLLPGGHPNGSPVGRRCFPLALEKEPLGILPLDLVRVEPAPRPGARADTHTHGHGDDASPAFEMAAGPLTVELGPSLQLARRFCLPVYRTPPERAQYLQLMHTLVGAPGMCINGRAFLGNTPTFVAGRTTRMRFGVIGMGGGTHTFHLHGHRWILPGPRGATPGAIQSSPQVQPVSPFEDTRIFGPASSFAFTIHGQPGSFMRAGGPALDDSLGEWHMHCHVMEHMMAGMMGSLLVVRGGELALGLPAGVPCPGHGHAPPGGHTPPAGATQHLVQMHPGTNAYSPANLTIAAGDTVRFENHDPFAHTVTWDTPGAPPSSGTIPAGGAYTTPPMTAPGTYAYHCAFHGAAGAGMHGTVTVA